MVDNVSHPNHYNHGGLECFDALRAALGDKYMGFLVGNVIKYCWRYEHKNGIEDLQKARRTLTKLSKRCRASRYLTAIGELARKSQSRLQAEVSEDD